MSRKEPTKQRNATSSREGLAQRKPRRTQKNKTHKRWTDSELQLLDRFVGKYGSSMEACELFGKSNGRSAKSVWNQIHRKCDACEEPIGELSERIRRMLKTGHTETTAEICRRMGCSHDRFIESIEYLRDAGYNLKLIDGKWNLDRVIQPATAEDNTFLYKSTPDNTFLFGVISDTHFCSKYAREDVTHDLYRFFESEGVERVYHAGNYIDGEARFNKHDLLIHGMDAQVDYLVENYPSIPGIKTYVVSGDDHEGWYAQREGIDIGGHVENKMRKAGREDWVNMGYMESAVRLVNSNTNTESSMFVVHPGGGCFDNTAEILTETRGWVPFEELTYQDHVATMTKDQHRFEWQAPTQITNEPYSGLMYKFKNRVMECTVTPNHKFLARRYKTYRTSLIPKRYPQKARHHFTPDWHIVSAEEIYKNYSRQKFQFPTTCKDWVGNNTLSISIPVREPKKYASTPIKHVGKILIEDAARLIAWYVTEGSAHKNGKQVTIAQSEKVNPENHAEIVELCKRIGFKPCISGVENKNICISSVELTNWLVAECGNGSRNKRLPIWLKCQNGKILKIVLETMIKGDGWVQGSNRTSWGYRTISTHLADDVIEIAQKCGYGVTSRKYGEDVAINIRVIQNNPTLNNKPEKIQYSGRIYCCTVPNGLIYVRVNGKCFWSHNSAYADSYSPQKVIESYEGGEKPAVAIYGHWHKMEMNEYRNVWYVQPGCCQDQTPFARKKRLRFSIGGAIVKATQDPETGAIVRFQVEFARYFDRGYYEGRNNRWNMGGNVNLPERSR